MTTSFRTTKPASELTRGDFVLHNGAVHQVRHVEPISYSNQYLLVVFAGGVTAEYAAECSAPIAFAEEIADAQGAGRRAALAGALHELASAIVDEVLPVPEFFTELRSTLDSRADVERWAEHLGVDVKMGGPQDNIPYAEQHVKVGGVSFEVHVQGPPEPVVTSGSVTASADGITVQNATVPR